jgi:hypothetical protein
MQTDLIPSQRESESDPDEFIPNVLVMGLNRDGTLLMEER